MYGMNIGQKIKAARLDAGLNQAELAERCGWGYRQGRISHYESGRREPKLEHIGAIEKALNIRLFTENSYEIREEGSNYMQDQERVWQEPDPSIYRTIKLMRLNLSAGITGAPVEYFDDEDEPLFFKNAWFDKRGIDPDKAAAMKVTGESMEPLLSSGDTVLVNSEETTPRHDKIFAVSIDDELVVKRLLEEREGWVLHSDNPMHRARPVTDNTRIIGRVRWISRDEI